MIRICVCALIALFRIYVIHCARTRKIEINTIRRRLLDPNATAVVLAHVRAHTYTHVCVLVACGHASLCD